MSQVRLIPDPIPNFPAIVYKGTPVLTTEMLAHAYGVNAKQIRQNFNNNRERFTEGKHFYMLSGNELREFRLCVEIIDAQISTKVRTLTLWTDRGAARHAKMLESDKAWDVYEMLEDTFFCVDKLAEEERALQENAKSIPQTTTPSTAEDRAPLRALVHAWAKITNVHHAALWPQVKAHFQLSRIDDLPAEWLPDALAFVQGKIDAHGKLQKPKQTPKPSHNAIEEIEQRIIALHAHVSKERHEICRDMGVAVWQAYGGDVAATMFHSIFTCVDKAIMDPSKGLSNFDLPGDLARRIAGLRDRSVRASGPRVM